jgi:hypothetical protein
VPWREAWPERDRGAPAEQRQRAGRSQRSRGVHRILESRPQRCLRRDRVRLSRLPPRSSRRALAVLSSTVFVAAGSRSVMPSGRRRQRLFHCSAWSSTASPAVSPATSATSPRPLQSPKPRWRRSLRTSASSRGRSGSNASSSSSQRTECRYPEALSCARRTGSVRSSCRSRGRARSSRAWRPVR